MKYKDFIARTENDRIQLSILMTLDKIAEHFNKPEDVPLPTLSQAIEETEKEALKTKPKRKR